MPLSPVKIAKGQTPSALYLFSLPAQKAVLSPQTKAIAAVVPEVIARPAAFRRISLPSLDQFYRDKFVLITGGSSGIGLALASQLASLGANLAITARTEVTLDSARQKIQQNLKENHFVHAFTSDVTKAESIREAISQLTQTHGIPDILINSAGVTRPGEFLKLDDSIFRWNMEVNYFGTLNAIRAVVPGMVERGSGIIANISSVAGYFNVYGYTAYGASKFAVNGLSEALRMELKPKGIQVSLIMPPDTDTPQLAYDNRYKPAITRMISGTISKYSAEHTADEILKGLSKRKYFILIGSTTKQLFLVDKILGRQFFYTVFDRLVRKAADRQNRRQR